MVDATHPFAAMISKNAVQAAGLNGMALVRLERPGWSEHPRARSWTWVPDADAARAAADSACRPFLTTGRQSLPDFASWADREVLVRLVDPPADPSAAALDGHDVARTLQRTPANTGSSSITLSMCCSARTPAALIPWPSWMPPAILAFRS